jgi:hypothetical protein
VYSYADRINTSMRFLNLYKMHGLRPNTSSFASLIWMLCRNEKLMQACLLKESLPKDVRVTEQMMDTLIFYAGKQGDAEVGQALLKEMRERGMRPPNEGRLRPLRKHLMFLGIEDENMPADPYAWREVVGKMGAVHNYGKKIRKAAIYLTNTGYSDLKTTVFNGYGGKKLAANPFGIKRRN